MAQPLRAERIVTVSVEDVARRAMEEHGGDLKAAAEAMHAEVLNDDSLYRAVAQPLLLSACQAACSKVRGAMRDFLWQQPDARETAARFARAVIARSIFDWPLSSGTRLGDATREALLAEVEHYEAQVRTMTERKAWLGKIAGRVPEGKTVAEVLSEAEVEGLKS